MKTTQSDLAFTNVEFVHNHMALSTGIEGNRRRLGTYLLAPCTF